MTTSEQVNEIAAALAAAQGEMGHAAKDAKNDHFKSRYADLASVREAAKPLAAHGIAVVQSCRVTLLESQLMAEVETRFIHKGGQWMADTLAVPVTKSDAQGVGSALTYARRYSLAAFAGIAPDDDDAEAAVGRNAAPRAVVSTPAGFEDWWTDMQATADSGTEALTAAWKASPNDYRQHAMATRRSGVDGLKAVAAKVAA
jgi:hypothetical protein